MFNYRRSKNYNNKITMINSRILAQKGKINLWHNKIKLSENKIN